MATAVRTPDTELLLRLRAREREAWEELYGAYQPRLRGFAYRLAGNVHDADDLVQETFVRAVPRLDELDPGTVDIGAYLFATLRNLFLKQVERGKRQQPVADVPEPSVPMPLEEDPERRTLLVRQQEEVRIANARLQPRQRLVLALRELEERSYAEIGEIVGMNENAVAQLIFRARESLRTELRLAQVDPESLPDECRRFLPLLAAHLDGQLKGARRDQTLAHLDDCERCQSALAEMQEASRRYRSLLPLLLEADEARAAIEQRLDEVGYWTRPGRLARRSLAIGAAATVALLTGGGVAIGVLTRDSADEPGPGARATAAAGTAESTDPAATASESLPVTTSKATSGKPPPKQKAKKQPPTATTGTTTAAQTQAAKPVAEPALTPAPTPPKPKPPPATSPPTAAPPPDITAPTVRIDSAPGASTSETSASFSFSANEDAVTFRCSLDGRAEAACASPASYGSLAIGSHTFAVRATDRAGNTGDAATHLWSVFELLPDLHVVAFSRNTITVGNNGTAAAGPSTLTITLVGTFSVPSLAPGALATFSWSTCRVGVYSAIVDRTNAVRESDEANNAASRRNTCG
jgi:RNA polymerase sigma factor (sigma-70 family)